LIPARWVGRGVPSAHCVDAARFEPKIDTSDPGAIGDEYEAAFTTPPITGAGVVCEYTAHGMTSNNAEV
jgi:hypothetical protein